MRHRCRVPQLGKPADQRKALLRSLATELIRHGESQPLKLEPKRYNQKQKK